MGGERERRDTRVAGSRLAATSATGSGDRQLLTIESAGEYLRQRGVISTGAEAHATELAGGISNVVLRVDYGGRSVVIKQSLAELRVADHWEFNPERILVECACLEVLGSILPVGAVPAVLDVDREALTLVMSCAPSGGTNWKEALLRGEVDPSSVRCAAELLAQVHREAASRPGLAARFADLMPLVEGRTNPYHHATALANPDLAEAIAADVDRLTSNRRTLVLGDYSPKNLIVYPDHVMALDFEVAHWGDPSFDSAFMLTHLIAKAVYAPERSSTYLAAARRFWSTYAWAAGDAGATEQETATELAVLLLCRVDGKSKLEYLNDDARALIRRMSRELISSRTRDLDEVFDTVEGRIHENLAPVGEQP